MRIAVLGAGPIGIEAAIHAQADGHEVVVFEEHRVGASLLRYPHVRWFSPWRDVTTSLGRSLLDLPMGNDRPHAHEIVSAYLRPLAETLDVRTRSRVAAIGRVRLRKHGSPGAASRRREAFRLLIEGDAGEFHHPTDAVLDCTGVTGQPMPAGVGGIWAPGERAAAEAGLLMYGPVPADGLQGMRIVVVGDGPSAVSVVADLVAQPRTRVTWITRDAAVPGFRSGPEDPLPARYSLWQEAQDALDQVVHMPDVHIARFRTHEDHTVGLTLSDDTDLKADRVIACTGFRPDFSIARELQLETSWSTEAPVKMSEALKAIDPPTADVPAGAELLEQHEPNYFVLGSKSWGRRARDFTLKAGHRQVLDVLELV